MDRVAFLALVLLLEISMGKTAKDPEWIVNLMPENYSVTSSLVNVNVDWSLKINSILTLSAKDMEFSLDLVMDIKWSDNLLGEIPKHEYAVLPTHLTGHLWFPYLEFTNCKACDQLLVDSDRHAYTVYQGLINVSYRQKFAFNCIFDLSKYPFDKQMCQINIKQTIWHGKTNLNIDDEIERYQRLDKKQIVLPSEYKLQSIEVKRVQCTPNQEMYLCYSYVFTFKRTILQNMINIFIPSILVVVLSWISFWLDVDLAAPRVAIGQTALLTLAAQFNSAQRNLPSVSTIKALDIWMFVCISMAFASILEYAFAYTFNKRKKTNTEIAARRESVRSRIAINAPPGNLKREADDKGNGCYFQSIDSCSKVMFPAFFIIFNFVFWLYYI